MVVTIKEQNGDSSDQPISIQIIQTAESNLDIIEFVGALNFQYDDLEEFEYEDYKGDVIFAGEFRTSELAKASNTHNGFDYGISLGEIKIRTNFQNMTPLEIIEDIITNRTGLTWVANASIVDGDDVILYPSQNKSAIEIINDMHRLLGTTHFVDVSKNFKVEYEGEELNPITLIVGDNCDLQKNKGWVTDTANLVKNLRVNGSTRNIEESELLDGTGAQTTFTLANPYVEIRVEHPVGTKLEPEGPDIQAGDYQIRQETNEIIFNVAPVSGTDNILVTYVYEILTNFNITEVNSTQILAGVNPHEVVIYKDYLKEVDDCEAFARKYKTKFENPLRSAPLSILDFDLTNYRANQRIRVMDTLHTVNGSTIDEEMIIKRIERGFGGEGLTMTIEVGDSNQFVFDKATEINERIQDFNEKNPTASIFNEGIIMTTTSDLQIQFDVDVDIAIAVLPANILVYDANRQYVNDVNHITPNDNFIYIDNADFIALFDEEDEFRLTEDGTQRITEDENARITE